MANSVVVDRVSPMGLLQILILALVQGAAELLPVSSSAHVIVAEKLLGLDPTAPQMTFLLVMLHTGTMLAVILHFRKRWWARISGSGRNDFLIAVASRSQREDGATLIGTRRSLIVGAVQACCLPFRGFSRSGATISAGMM